MSTRMPAAASHAPAEAGRTPAVVLWLVAAAFVVILNETIMMNAIPQLMEGLDIDEAAAQWLSTAFLLTMAAVIPVTGWFLQRVTTRAAFATAMTIFIVGTVLAAAAPAYPVLLVARIIQASGTAIMMPLLMTTLMTVVPERDRGRVMGNVTLVMSVAPALGPAVSGLLLGLGSWRLMFLTVLPIAVVVTIAALRRLPNVGEPRQVGIDWFSVVVAALGFGGLVFGLSRFGQGLGALPWLLVGGSLVTITVFVLRQLQLQRRGNPLLDLRTFRHRVFTRAVLLLSVAFMAMLGAMLLLPLYLQQVRGLSALEAGLLVMPGGIAMGLLGPRVGRVFDRFGSRVLIIPGAVGVALAMGSLTLIDTQTPYWQLLAAHMLLMVSLAGVFTPTFTLGLGDVPGHLYSHGSSLLGTLQQVAGALGTAIVITIMTARADRLITSGTAPLEATVEGMRWGFGFGAVTAVIVIGLVLLMPNRLPQQEAGEQEPGRDEAGLQETGTSELSEPLEDELTPDPAT
ncbi:MDR family MFS transporter [Ornithinimicrobium cavernae]|uniref:MDR family MFS transporter n=1 Tax=Ornithinimicrobium cavernae TaxID=2666047 RepID=UPI001F36CDF5|nr:MDR family MFS transporter [Ornithinimicrobium cavernae]